MSLLLQNFMPVCVFLFFGGGMVEKTQHLACNGRLQLLPLQHQRLQHLREALRLGIDNSLS